MSSLPKCGWKYRRCRVCSDCGSKIPGTGGAASRWHPHFTICDSCYQQRNKGFSCPICQRAYKAAAYKEMVKCSKCNRFVHSTCDSEADLSVYYAKKESNPDYDYICPCCKSQVSSGQGSQSLVRQYIYPTSATESEGSSSHHMQNYQEDNQIESFDKTVDYPTGKGKPFLGMKIGKKGLTNSLAQYVRYRGKLPMQKRSRISEFGRKRGPKPKMRIILGVPESGLQRPTSGMPINRSDEEPGLENRLVLCSAKDKFILTLDICVMCGAVGVDQESCLIACIQCGQCYHPYCANVRITEVILKRGWRCLDCTVCEGCGQKNDEARLILCDECDISFHTYCMDPPLEFVPQGNWKCKWCAICQKCGKNDPGKNCYWRNSYSECGPCASQNACASCLDIYIEGELIIQCTNCNRWLHCKCDYIDNVEEAEKCDEYGYVCLLCRPKGALPPHLSLRGMSSMVHTPVENLHVLNNQNYTQISQSLEGSHYIDGVCLSEQGLGAIKSLQMECIRKKRKKLNSELNENNKNAAIMAAIESVVAGSSTMENSLDDVKIEPLDVKEEAEIYKNGMLWDPSDANPPDGFTLGTNEEGAVVLRKKRQRNLQKLGIGGFNVRNRTLKRDWLSKDETEHSDCKGLMVNYIDFEKKKKPLKKKQKNILTETYPVYLQEAFFGKNLLDKDKTSFESESSEGETQGIAASDKLIKLTHDEIKFLNEMQEEDDYKKVQYDNKDFSSNIDQFMPDKKNKNEFNESFKSISQDFLTSKLANCISNVGEDGIKIENNP